jgi:hypothetical protein
LRVIGAIDHRFLTAKFDHGAWALLEVSGMSKPLPGTDAYGRRRRILPSAVRHTIAMIASHPGATALGGLTGLLAGAVSGSLAGVPGALSGAGLGWMIGAAAGAALGADYDERHQQDAELDRVIGVSEGNIGEARADGGMPGELPEGTSEPPPGIDPSDFLPMLGPDDFLQVMRPEEWPPPP